MGNSRNQQRRVGVKRCGPAQRAQATEEENLRIEEEHLRPENILARERAAERQRQCREKKRRVEEASRLLPTSDEGAPSRYFGRRDASRVSNKLVSFIIEEFRSETRGPEFRKAVMESVLRNTAILPHLPDYYLCPSEARAQHHFIENYRTELEALKNPSSKEKFVRKTTLLEAAVSRDVSGVRALSRVLGTKASNISNAIQRRQALESNGSSIFTLAERRRREGMSHNTKALVNLWWTSETRVSPNKKDVTRKRLGPKMYEQHPTHFLLESQVRFEIHILIRIKMHIKLYNKRRPVHSMQVTAGPIYLLSTCVCLRLLTPSQENLCTTFKFTISIVH